MSPRPLTDREAMLLRLYHQMEFGETVLERELAASNFMLIAIEAYTQKQKGRTLRLVPTPHHEPHNES